MTFLPKVLMQWAFLFVSNLVLVLAGLLVVPLALPFAGPGVSVSDGRAILNLPMWAYIWGNDFDGAWGDKHGNWKGVFGFDKYHFVSMFWWLAIRNPANNMRRIGLWQCPVEGSSCSVIGKSAVRDAPGEGGWQFVTFTNAGKDYYGFYLVHEWNAERAFVVRLGFKIQPSQIGSGDQPKGFTFKVNPWKNIA